MDKMRSPLAKILVHAEGLGAPTADTVRRRAQELAAINGHENYTDGDWHQARLELHGGHLNGELSDEMAMPTMVSEADMLAVDVGHHVGRLPLEDEPNVLEELWQEGLDEAEHERMLQSRRIQRREEAGFE